MAKKDVNINEKKKNNFGKELKSELKKVSWPSLKQLVNNTTAVVSIVLIISVIVFILDVCFESLNDFGINRLKSLVSSETTENTEATENMDTDNNTDETSEVEGENDIVDGTVETEESQETETVVEETNTDVNSEKEEINQ